MPITFGAVGDIISVCLLVKDLVAALDKARGSKAEYQSAIRELWILDRALLEIDLLSRVHGNGATLQLQSLCVTAERAVARCKALVSAFQQRMHHYKHTLGDGEKPNLIHGAAMKLRWRVDEKEALDQFRVEIAGSSQSLQMLLATANVTLMSINRKEINDKLHDAEEQNKVSSSSQHALLCNIQGRIEDANQGINAANSVLGKITDVLRLDWLRQLGSELKGLLHRSIAINIATYQAVLRSQSPLPSQLERGLIEEPMILEDAIGRKAPVHLQFVTSWEALQSILEVRFRDIQGHKKIMQKQYGLQDGASGREVERSRAWQSAFLPGQRVEMSMVFHSEEPASSDFNNATCPGCHTPTTSSTDSDIQCSNCSIWYRRITVVEDETSSVTTSMEHAPMPGSVNTSGRDSLSRNRKRVQSDENSDDEEDEEVRDFKRVRIMSRPKRNDHVFIIDHTGQTNAYQGNFHLKTSMWEDENTYCFEVGLRGTTVARREDNNMINATRLLSVANVPRTRRTKILRTERIRHDVKLGPRDLKGTWFTFERALELGNQFKITHLLYPLFVHDIMPLLRSPLNKAEAPYTSTYPADDQGVMRSTNLQDIREPVVAGPIHPSWETAIEEETNLRAPLQDMFGS